MRIEPDVVKGFRDYLPPESNKRKKIREVIEKYFRLYGFQPVETPTIEFDEIMRQDDTLEEEDQAVSDRFRLQDKGGRKLGLRYEFTFQLARIFKQHPNIKLPFRRYQIGSNFRDEPTSAYRTREFTQCDADIIGDSSIEADAECVALFNDIVKELKVPVEIQVNNRKLLNAIIESVQIQNKIRVMRELDKMDKIGEDAVKGNLKKYSNTNQIITLFKILEKPLEFFIKNLFEGADEIKKLQGFGKYYGYKINFNSSLARGFAYYTGNIIEFVSKEKKITIAAGGRYDKVAGKYLNKDLSAVGISFGMDRLISFTELSGDITKCAIISLNQDKESINIAKLLRKQGTSCLLFFGKPGKWLDYADSQGIPYVIFVGTEEIAQKKFKLKDMKSGDENLLSEKQIIIKLKK